jgi:hypothetical protein
MRRAIAWIAGLAGIAALARLLRARRATAPPVVQAPAAPADDPAEELRRALERSRAAQADTAAPEPVEPDALDERRARVHAKAQEAIDAMRATDGPE